jgi:hypothetical protein
MGVLVTLQYNESTLLLVLKHMIYSLTHPTPPLEALTREHFRRRAPAIIRRCQRILDKTPSAGASTTTHASSTPATCSSSSTADGGGSGVGGGASAGVGTGDEQESGERAEDGANDNVTDNAVGWADRSFAFSVDLTPLTARMLKRVCHTSMHPSTCWFCLTLERGRERDGRMRVLAVAIIDGHTIPLLLLFVTLSRQLISLLWVFGCGRSVPEFASKGFLRSLEKLLPRLKAVLAS